MARKVLRTFLSSQILRSMVRRIQGFWSEIPILPPFWIFPRNLLKVIYKTKKFLLAFPAQMGIPLGLSSARPPPDWDYSPNFSPQANLSQIKLLGGEPVPGLFIPANIYASSCKSTFTLQFSKPQIDDQLREGVKVLWVLLARYSTKFYLNAAFCVSAHLSP